MERRCWEIEQNPRKEMNQDTFWALIQEAKTACGQDMDAMEAYLYNQLVSMGPAAAEGFHDLLQAYEDLADQYGLWDAASIIKEHGCSDDGFIDFRAWLIAQGKEVYMNALREPDTLADVEPYGDCCFECLSYVGDYAYEQLTGRSAYDEMEHDTFRALREELAKDLVYRDGIQYPREPKDLPQFLPRLCEKYGGPERFQAMPAAWNFDLHEVRRLLDQGIPLNKPLKKEKGGGMR